MRQTSQIVFTPAECASLAIQALEELKSNKGRGIKSGIGSLDDVMLPMVGGELITVIGYTSHYKSGFMGWLLKSAIRQIEDDEAVVRVTWEDSVEDETIKWIASDASVSITSMVRGELDDWEVVMNSYKKRIATPLYIVGHSTRRSEEQIRARPRMTMSDVESAIEFISNGVIDKQLKIRMIVLDYLQRIRPDEKDGFTKREQMLEAVNKAKDLALSFGCPVVLGVQASREVLNRDYKLPRLDDGQETSNIEQSSDKVISLWYPIKTEPEGTKIEINNLSVTQNLLICGLLKQKLGVAPVVLPLYVDPARNMIAGMMEER